jgi:hypothetical protein
LEDSSVRVPSERNASERPSSRVRFDFSFLFLISRPHYRLVLDNKNPSKLRHKTKSTHAFQSWPFPPSLLRSYLYSLTPLVSRPQARTTSNQHKPPPRGSRTLTSSPWFSYPFMRLHISLSIPHHRHPRGPRYYTKLRPADRYRACIQDRLLLVEEGIEFNQEGSLFFFPSSTQ